MERTPRRGNRKIIPSHHSSRALSCLPSQPRWPPFLHYFFICQWYWGRRWSGDITCPFIEMKQTLFSPFNLPHPQTPKGPSWAQSIAQLQNGQGHVTVAPNSCWQLLRGVTGISPPGFEYGTLYSARSVCLHLTFQQKARSFVNKPLGGRSNE